jgi:hypothetical protein
VAFSHYIYPNIYLIMVRWHHGGQSFANMSHAFHPARILAHFGADRSGSDYRSQITALRLPLLARLRYRQSASAARN